MDDRAELIRRGRQASGVVDNADGKNALIRDLCDALEAAPEAPGQEAVACAKATSQTCAHYGGAPARCLFDTRTWAEGTTPERCSGCPEAPGQEAGSDVEPKIFLAARLASARQEGFEAGLKAAVDRYADAETWDYFLAAEEAILALSTKGAEG